MSALLNGLRGLWQFWPIAIALGLMLAPVRSRKWPWVIVGSTLVLTPLALSLGWITLYAARMEALIFITAILAVSLNLINGLTGLFSIGHAGFAIVGGYAAGILTTFVFQLGPETRLPLAIPAFVVSLLLGGLAAAAFGFLVGLPTLRLRGDYLAIATLGFGEIICVVLRFITFRRPVGEQVFEVGGPRGIQDIPAMPGLPIPGTEVAMPVLASFVYSLVALALIVWAIRNLSFSSHGRACAAIREDEVAAEILGVDTVFYKVGAFTIGAFFAGVGGALLAHWSNMLHPSMGGFVRSIEYLIIVYIGGVGSISGSLLAAALLLICGETLKDVLRDRDAWRMVLYGGILIAVMLWRPRGLYGDREFPWLMPRGRSTDGPA
jgi:branched-chain amino acid transport system permease protein